MMSGEPTLTESPVPLALARLQGRSGRQPRGLLLHRPSLPLASLQEAVDESPRRFSQEPPVTPDTDEDDPFAEYDAVNSSPATGTNGRRASDAAFAERYRKLNDFDGPPPEAPRRASLAVPPAGEAYAGSDKGRRRSWAAKLQLERKKRRKSGSGGADTDEETDSPTYIRQKRPSWWNVFVPDNVLKNRSRRASQQLSRSAESIDQAFKRSKSRSVDHGLAAPFDLDALRSKVEGRFDAVHRDEDEHKRLPPPPPIKTMTYTVRDRDTLTSLAARFDTTPSELTKLNRLGTQFIFPGQALLVPDKRKDGDKESEGRSESGDNTSDSTAGPTSEPANEKEMLDSLRPVSPEAPASSSSPQRFLKINVRHITDGQGVVSGVLLVTPNAVMFDPNVSDTLVMEHGPESYGVIAPMEYVVNAAIFYDIAHMRTHPPHHNAQKAENAEIYYMNKPELSPGKDSLLVKDETFPELQSVSMEGHEGEDRPGSGDAEDRGGAAFPKAFDRDLVTPTALQQQTTEDRRKSLLDHHWAIPSKDRMSIDQGSEVSSTADNAEKNESIDGSIVVNERAESTEGDQAPDEPPAGDDGAQHLVKLSYHDSGIDIRDPLLHVTQAQQKKERHPLFHHHEDYYHEIETIYETPEEKSFYEDWDCDVTYEKNFLEKFALHHPHYSYLHDDVEMRPLRSRISPYGSRRSSFGSRRSSIDPQPHVWGQSSIDPHESRHSSNDPQGSKRNSVDTQGSVAPFSDAHGSRQWLYHRHGTRRLSSDAHESNTPFFDAHGSKPPPVDEHESKLPSFHRHGSKRSSLDSNGEVYSDADIVLSAEWVPPVCLPRTDPPLSAPPLGENERGPRKQAAVSFSLDGSNQKPDDIGKPDKKNKMLKRLSYPLSWVEGLTGDGAPAQGSQSDSMPNSADSHNSTSVFSKVFNRRSSLGGFGRSNTKSSSSTSSTQPRLDYRSMVSVDDMPDLFASFDKLIPRPARASDDPPLYLRLRMGKPAGRPLPRTTPLMSYGRKRMKPEYWFGIPRNRVDDLFKFLTHWTPDRYGPLGDVTAQGYELIDSDTEFEDDEPRPGQRGERTGSTGDVSDLTRESWELLKAPYVKIYSIMKSQAEALGDTLGEEPRPEVLSMSDELRRALYSSGASIDMEFCPPDLIGTSEIFTMEHREKLCTVLPARAQGYMWSLAFSTSQHGFSLASMYRKMQRVDSPVLLVIQDTDNNVFGALTSCALHPSEHFYGTGESLLFSFQRVEEQAGGDPPPRRPSQPDEPSTVDAKEEAKDAEKKDDEKQVEPAKPVKTKFKYWGWTGDNMYFIRGSNDNISIGAGDGKFGLWLDGDLYLGRTQCCTTYGNDPLTTREDFVVKIMECWTFI